MSMKDVKIIKGETEGPNWTAQSNFGNGKSGEILNIYSFQPFSIFLEKNNSTFYFDVKNKLLRFE